MTRTLFFEITDRCNHACFYCCKSFRGQPGITMNSGALDKVLSLPASGLVISGGVSLCAGTGDRPRGDQHQLVLLDA